MHSVTDDVRVGLVDVDVREKLENACVSDGCGCRTSEGVFDEVGRRRTVVKALVGALAKKCGWEVMSSPSTRHVV